jgi:hypothetical protein
MVGLLTIHLTHKQSTWFISLGTWHLLSFIIFCAEVQIIDSILQLPPTRDTFIWYHL